MSPKVYKKSLILLSSVSLGRAKLLSTNRRLSKLEIRKDYSIFRFFVF